MSFSRTRVKAIAVKELRNYRRNRFVIGTVTMLPVLFIALPKVQLIAANAEADTANLNDHIGLSPGAPALHPHPTRTGDQNVTHCHTGAKDHRRHGTSPTPFRNRSRRESSRIDRPEPDRRTASRARRPHASSQDRPVLKPRAFLRGRGQRGHPLPLQRSDPLAPVRRVTHRAHDRPQAQTPVAAGPFSSGQGESGQGEITMRRNGPAMGQPAEPGRLETRLGPLDWQSSGQGRRSCSSRAHSRTVTCGGMWSACSKAATADQAR